MPQVLVFSSGPSQVFRVAIATGLLPREGHDRVSTDNMPNASTVDASALESQAFKKEKQSVCNDDIAVCIRNGAAITHNNFTFRVKTICFRGRKKEVGLVVQRFLCFVTSK